MSGQHHGVPRGHSLDKVTADVVDVILPCLDEAPAFPWVLARMPSWARAIVADNGSTDGSAEIARSMGPTVIDVRQRGYGSACQAGLQAATADLVAFMDADASLDPLQLACLRTSLVGDVDLDRGSGYPLDTIVRAVESGWLIGQLTSTITRAQVDPK